jgi:hypothetical protein
MPAAGAEPAQPGARPAAGSPQPAAAPEEHGYDFSAFTIGEQDAPMFQDFGNAMHQAGAPQEHVAAALSWYEANQAREFQAEEESNTRAAIEARAALQEEWGSQFAPNLRILDNYLEDLPPSLSFALRTAYTEDGILLLNDVDAINWLLGQARGPVRGSGAAPKAPGDERAELEAMMANARSPYWKGPQAERLQARYRDLTQAPPVARPGSRPTPSASGGAPTEIAKFEAMMRDPRSEYWKGPNAEKNQARYRALIGGGPSVRRESQHSIGDKRRFDGR